MFDRFLVDLGVENRVKIYQKIIKEAIKNKMRFGMDFEGLLERSWGDFEPKLGAKLGPTWSPKSFKIRAKSDPKCDQFLDRLGNRFLERLGANLAPSWLPKPPQNGAKLAPKSIQVGVLI